MAAGQRCPRRSPNSPLPTPTARDEESLRPTQGHMSHITSRLLILSLLATEAIESQMGKQGACCVIGHSWVGPGHTPPRSLLPTSWHVILQLPWV